MWHTTDETPREGADIVAMNEHRAELGFYRRGDLHICGGASRIAVPLVAFTHWAYAPGEASGQNEHRRRRVDDELPQHEGCGGERMSKVKWTRQTPTFWAAGIDGYGISVKRMVQQSTGMKFYTAFFIADGIHWHSEGMNHLKYAKAAAEQMAQRWAKGEG